MKPAGCDNLAGMRARVVGRGSGVEAGVEQLR